MPRSDNGAGAPESPVPPTEKGAPEPQAAPAAGGAPDRKATSATSSVRVDAERLDQLMHVMGELVVDRTHVESLLVHAQVPGLQDAMNDLTRSSQALQAMVMQVRMIPVEAVFLRFPRLVRDLSGKLGKKVDLLLSGSETELDRTVVDRWATRSCTSCATRSTMVSSPPRSARRRASRRRERSRSRRSTRAAAC